MTRLPYWASFGKVEQGYYRLISPFRMVRNSRYNGFHVVTCVCQRVTLSVIGRLVPKSISCVAGYVGFVLLLLFLFFFLIIRLDDVIHLHKD